MADSRFPRTPIPLSMAMAMSLVGVAHADTVDTIYAAENALYGAGYEVGKVDGWMDDALRSAIRQYQAGTEGAPTGNLDEATLESLGISVLPGTEITGNDVSDRSAAMAALGLETSGRRTVTARRPEPEPAPEPAPALEEPAPTEDPKESAEAQTAATDAPAEEQEVSTTAGTQAPAPVSDDAPVDTDQAQIEPQAETAGDSGNTPTETPVTAGSAGPSESEVQSAEAPVAEPVTPPPSDDEPTADSNAQVSNDVTDERSDDTAEETVTVVASEPETPEAGESGTTPEATPQISSGGFFSRVFDFLFGWIF